MLKEKINTRLFFAVKFVNIEEDEFTFQIIEGSEI